MYLKPIMFGIVVHRFLSLPVSKTGNFEDKAISAPWRRSRNSVVFVFKTISSI